MAAPTDLIFQSIAGSEKGNAAFGFSAETIEEARSEALHRGTAEGPNVMYFETGQGSELSSEAHFDTDQVTMEARCYGFAKHFHRLLSILLSVLSARNIFMTAGRSAGRGLKTILWESLREFLWGAMPAIQII